VELVDGEIFPPSAHFPCIGHIVSKSQARWGSFFNVTPPLRLINQQVALVMLDLDPLAMQERFDSSLRLSGCQVISGIRRAAQINLLIRKRKIHPSGRLVPFIFKPDSYCSAVVVDVINVPIFQD